MIHCRAMLRRAVLQTPLAAALVRPSSSVFKLSVRVEPLFPKATLEEQIRLVAEAGYHGFEFGDWRAADPKRVVALADKLGLKCVCIVGNRGVNPVGMGLCNPAERAGFLTELKASAEAAVRFETKKVVILTGFRVPRMTMQAQRASVIEGLKRGHDIVSRHNVTMIVEPINTIAPIEPLNPTGDNHHRYFLDRAAEAFRILKEVDSPLVKVLYDMYHVQIMEGNLIETIRRHVSEIAHFHVGDVPGRHEPGTGEIHYGNVFRAIRETGYTGYVGMEYVPSRNAMTTLRDTRALALSA